jgi:hypothetical protein
MSPESLAAEIQSFLAESPRGALLEDGFAIFDVSTTRFSLSTERDKCLLHAWSEERNIVRRVLDCERKHGSLRIKVQKFGAAKPQTLEIVTDRDQRSPSTKRSQRSTYQRLLARILAREFPGYSIERLSSSPDLERSFGPVHARALVKKGNSAFAIVGVNAAEDQTSVDNLLTTAILWLHDCRERVGHKLLVEGVRIFAPRGKSAVLRARLAYLNHAAAKFELSEIEERDELIDHFDVSDSGNLFTRLVRSPDRATVEARFNAAITDIRRIVPETEINIQSPTEVAFRFRGLEFARARQSLAPNSFAQQMEITFGAGPFETAFNADTQPLFSDLMSRVQESRSVNGTKHDALYRMQSERWLESIIRRDVSVIDSNLDADCVYAQVPAFAASDRAMIDLLTVTKSGRLAVLELKADEDLHLPLQGLDYWSRVQWHHQRGEFQQFGYFTDMRGACQLSPEPPLLYLVAPALRVHPATDTLLRYLSSRIDVTLVGINERWREGVEVVFRKRRSDVLKARA